MKQNPFTALMIRLKALSGRKLSYLPKDMKAYILNTALQTSRDHLINLFMLVFIWKVTSDLLTVCRYRLAIAFVIPLSALAAGALARKFDRVTVFRVGLLLYLPFLLILLLLGERAGAFAVLFGLLAGLADGFYWTARNTLDFEFGRGRNAARFLGLQSSVTAAVGLAAPFLFGTMIEYTPRLPLLGEHPGYAILFFIAILIAATGVVLSFLLPRDRAKKTPIDPKVFWPFTTSLKWSLMLLLGLFSSFRFSVAAVLSAILFFHIIPSEMALGGIQSAGTVLTVLLAYASGIFVTPKNRMIFHAVAMGCYALSCGLLGTGITPLTVILFILLQKISDGLIRIPTATIRYDVIRSLPGHEESKTDFMVAAEPFLAVGRIAGLLLMIGVIRHLSATGRGQFDGVRIWLTVLSILPLFEWTLLYLIHRRLNHQGHAGRHLLAP